MGVGTVQRMASPRQTQTYVLEAASLGQRSNVSPIAGISGTQVFPSVPVGTTRASSGTQVVFPSVPHVIESIYSPGQVSSCQTSSPAGYVFKQEIEKEDLLNSRRTTNV